MTPISEGQEKREALAAFVESLADMGHETNGPAGWVSPLAPGEPEQLLAAAAELRRMAWQPIATAPKDGTDVLLGWPTMVLAGFWNRKCWTTAHGSYVGGNTPTHWQPLPAPPASEGTP